MNGILMKDIAASIDRYLGGQGVEMPLIEGAPEAGLGQVVVIPAFDEPDLTGALDSLWHCRRPECPVEVLVILNDSEQDAPEVRQRNGNVFLEAAAWAEERSDRRFRCWVRHFPGLSGRRAGVGSARKIGMDEACRRLLAAGNPEAGVIVCFDADCRCLPEYLRAVEEHFQRHPGAPGCSIRFEHPLSGPESREVYEAVVRYELHLRYHVNALRLAGHPFAFQTVGSSMAVRASAYVLQGGMNRRRAGEDFYFLQKIIPLGGFTELNSTCVFPSPRLSHRVPFGTGRAVAEMLDGATWNTYPFAAYLELKRLFAWIRTLAADSGCHDLAIVESFGPALHGFLESRSLGEVMDEIRAHTASPSAFIKRFFRWFNMFQAMKFLHHARDTCYGKNDVAEAAWRLAKVLELNGGAGARDERSLLQLFREHDRAGACVPGR